MRIRSRKTPSSLTRRAFLSLAFLLNGVGACAGRDPTTPDPMGATDTSVPWPIDAGATDAIDTAPQTYKGLPLRLVTRADPVVTAVDGVIGVVCIGMSNAQQECARLIAATNTGGPWAAQLSAQVRIVNCAVGSHAIERWIDSSYDATLWDACLTQRLPERGVRPDQVRVLLHKAANQNGIGPGGTALPMYPNPGANYFRLREHLDQFAARVPTFFPQVQVVFVSSRSYGGFTTRPERGEPQSYEEGHAVNSWLAANASVGGVWYGWGGYLWAPACTTGRSNGAGICYDREDYEADAVHPSGSGETKMARLQHDRFRNFSWYRP